MTPDPSKTVLPACEWCLGRSHHERRRRCRAWLPMAWHRFVARSIRKPAQWTATLTHMTARLWADGHASRAAAQPEEGGGFIRAAVRGTSPECCNCGISQADQPQSDMRDGTCPILRHSPAAFACIFSGKSSPCPPGAIRPCCMCSASGAGRCTRRAQRHDGSARPAPAVYGLRHAPPTVRQAFGRPVIPNLTSDTMAALPACLSR
jgi:hypothetical protein